MADLRYNLRKKDAPSRRRIMRTYGARFSYNKREQREEEDIADVRRD